MCLQCSPGQQCLFGFCTVGSSGAGGGTANTGGGSNSATGGSGNVTGGSGNVTGGGTGGNLPMRVFITSVGYAGTFGGTSQADALCTSAAQAANKGGTWKAWLSSSASLAATRMGEVGPWHQQLADGTTVLTFNNKSNLATTPIALLGVDEMGRETNNSYWTGTLGGGALGSNCSGWTSSGNLATYGSAGQSGTGWTSYSSDYCSYAKSLLCFEQSHLPLPAAPATTHKRVFITSVGYAGTFGSTTQADALCTTAAQAANKNGTWKAWLSTSASLASSRINEAGPWYQQLADGSFTLTFNNKANFTTTPLAPLGVDEMGRETNNSYWTGTQGGGALGSTCSGWTSSGNLATYGSAGQSGTGWTSYSSDYCSYAKSLLCFEQ
jgi:hypothetical protein